jgi:DNA-binding NtrC family response regulator
MAIHLLCIAGKSLQHEESLFQALRGIRAIIAGSTWEGLELVKSSRFDAVLVSMPLDESSAAELLEQIRRIQPLTPVVIRDPRGTLADAVRLTKLGAYQFTGGHSTPEDVW